MATRRAGATRRRAGAAAGARSPLAASRPLSAAHAAVGLVVVAGVLAQVVRPLAPGIGPVLEPATWFEPEHLDLVRRYRDPRYAAAAVALAVQVAVPLLLVLTARGRRLVDRVASRAGGRAAPREQGPSPAGPPEARPAAALRQPALAAAVVVVGALVATDAVLLPLSFWAGFVHEGAFGFRTYGLAGWAYDWLVARAPTWVAAGGLTLAGYALVRRLPRAWPPVAALAGAALVAVVVFASPLVLEPLRVRTEPLGPGPVRAEVERVLRAAGEDVDRIVVADASRRTTKVNAYVSGLGSTRRVVLYDNLVATRPPGEVGLVVAHELGHHQHADLPRGVAGGAAAVAVLAYVLAWVLRRRAAAGRQDGAGDPRGAAVALAVVVVLSTVTLPLQLAVSRRAEAAADHAALRITSDPDTFLAAKEQLARANLSDAAPPWWAYVLWYTHPPTGHRLTMGERWVEKGTAAAVPAGRAPGARQRACSLRSAACAADT